MTGEGVANLESSFTRQSEKSGKSRERNIHPKKLVGEKGEGKDEENQLDGDKVHKEGTTLL